ncbi:MAG: hypothetical protein IIB26_06265 [Chloroflexi bacterium]|nr:hypothetical protein [Chloroflexota bacterium]
MSLYEYPDASLNDSLAIGRRIAREFMGSVSRSTLAGALQMSDRGGGFGARIGAMRIWGIVEGRGTIRLTRNGLRAVNPLTPEESAMARRDLASSVPLFMELAGRLDGIPPDRARLALLLEDITGANRMEIERRLQVIARVFEEVLPLLPGPGATTGERARRPATSDVRAASTDDDGDSGLGFLDIPSLLDDPASAAAALSPAPEPNPEKAGDPRIEVVFPGGRISLPETIASLDVIIQVLQERRGNLTRGSSPASF